MAYFGGYLKIEKDDKAWLSGVSDFKSVKIKTGYQNNYGTFCYTIINIMIILFNETENE